jgi:hypothetical protein
LRYRGGWDLNSNVQSIYEIIAATGAWKPASYLPIYERLFESIRSMPLAVLELGIYKGGSLKAWEAYFPYARIAGVDADPPTIEVGARVQMFAGNQADVGLLSRVAAEVAPDGFDVVIDDCSHIGALAKISFWHLFDHHLKPGGLYCIEDWGTGYLATWPDGCQPRAQPDTEHHFPSHDAGMVGFIKQLVDELHAFDPGTPEPRLSKFTSMSLHAGICIVRKAGELTWRGPERLLPALPTDQQEKTGQTLRRSWWRFGKR